MSPTITVTYEHGVFIPQKPVDLPEHAVVELVLSPKSHKKPRISEAEAQLLSLRGLCHELAGTDAVKAQKKLRSEWRGQ